MKKDEKFLKIVKINNVYGRVITNDPFIIKDLYNYFSMFVKNHWFQPKVKAGTWDGKIHLVWKNGQFPLGLYKEVLQFVKRNNLKILIDKQLKIKTEIKDFEKITLEWLDENWIPRVYQIEGALKAIRNRRCILEHATGSGKSLTLALIMMYFFITEEVKKTLILVPSLGLIEQMESDLISYGVPHDWIGKFNKDIKDKKQPIIISTWQSMAKQKKLTEQFDLLITDECHSLQGDVVRSVSENAINADIRIGCTGSMPDFKTDKYQVTSTLGPVLHIVKAKKLIDQGFISDIKIKLYHLIYPDYIKKELKGADYHLEKDYIENYNPRNNIIKFITHKHAEKDQNVLILATKLDHLDKIKESLENVKSIKHLFLIIIIYFYLLIT
ncbi:MAG: DEAD/DEAH box helicase family protein [Atribacterota bacterium]